MNSPKLQIQNQEVRVYITHVLSKEFSLSRGRQVNKALFPFKVYDNFYVVKIPKWFNIFVKNNKSHDV